MPNTDMQNMQDLSNLDTSNTVNASRYLTSAESLERLCKLQPDKPISYGIGKVFAGIGLLCVSGGAGWLGWDMLDTVKNSYDTIGKVIGSCLEIMVGGIGLASLGCGFYLLGDGITSLGKPIGINSYDNYSYYRNGGFIDKPSIFDKKFGSKVIPIERTSELNQVNNGLALVNRIHVQDTHLKSESKTRYLASTVSTGKTSTVITIPQPYTEYTAILEGILEEQPIKLYTVTEDENFAKKLAALKKDSVIYAVGEVDEEKDIDLSQYGDAFQREE